MSKSHPLNSHGNTFDHPFWRWFIEHSGAISIPLHVDLSEALVSNDKVPAPRPEQPKPSRDLLPTLVRDAQSVITFDGGNPKRRPTKRQHIDKMSYAYGVLWGIAHALDCSVGEVLDRHGHND